jgi:starvation-inducible outer membrane lipoprotein
MAGKIPTCIMWWWPSILSALVIVTLFILLAFGLAGCGGNSNGVSVAPTTTPQHQDSSNSNDQPVHWTELNNGAYIMDIRMPSGRTLVCIEDSYANESSALSVSCNWEAYNK